MCVRKLIYFAGALLIFTLIIRIRGFFDQSTAFAYQIQKLDLEKRGDFVVTPAKTELFLQPGDVVTKDISITNRTGEIKYFIIQIAGFQGSNNPEEVVVILDRTEGSHILKDYVKPELVEFSLDHGDRIVLPVKISIPPNAEPGGLYSAVLISIYNSPSSYLDGQSSLNNGQVNMITRLSSLFFIRIAGEVLEDGYLEALDTSSPGKTIYEKGPTEFELLFRNRGNVHLTPYGDIEIKGIWGQKVDKIKIDPWFIMPNSLRAWGVHWNKNLSFGHYTAIAHINRGYDDIIDQKTVAFWVIPWRLFIIAGTGCLVITGILIFLIKKGIKSSVLRT